MFCLLFAGNSLIRASGNTGLVNEISTFARRSEAAGHIVYT